MSKWYLIESAPKMKTVLLFANTDIDGDGVVKNWKMGTGYWHEGYGTWRWEGLILKSYDVKPTHWMSLPEPPHTPQEKASD